MSVSALFVLLLVSSFRVSVSRAQPFGAPGLIVRFFAAGHGDSVFLRTRSGHNVLIDAGTGRWKWGDHLVRRRILPFFRKMGIRHLDAFIITHPHNDHFGDPATLRRYIRFPCIYTNADGRYHLSRLLPALMWAAGQPIPLVTVQSGDSLRFGGLNLQVINPPAGGKHPSQVLTRSRQNNRSLVIVATYGRVRFLLPADVRHRTQRRILRSGVPIRADVLKIGHHGLGGSYRGWLEAIRPRYAVQTCCDGPWLRQKPTPILRQLARLGVPVFRLDKHRDVQFSTDGVTLQVNTFDDFSGLGRRHRAAAVRFDRRLRLKAVRKRVRQERFKRTAARKAKNASRRAGRSRTRKNQRTKRRPIRHPSRTRQTRRVRSGKPPRNVQ